MDTLALTKKIAALAVPILELTPVGGAAVRAAAALRDVVEEIQGTTILTTEQSRQLDQTRDQLEAAVNEHANRTAASLGD